MNTSSALHLKRYDIRGDKPRAVTAMIALIAGSLAIACTAPALAMRSAQPPRGQTVLANVGGVRITEEDVLAFDTSVFEQQRNDVDHQLRQLHFAAEQAKHELLQQQLNKLLDQRALELEAKDRGVTSEAMFSDIKVAAVTEAEIRGFYDTNKDRSSMSYEQLAPQIKQYLANEHNDQATRSFYDSLRVKHGITSLLEPYRVPVLATGPSRGGVGAPITIVEFADFQCPYCKQAESTLQLVLARHHDDVRLVFRHLPLSQLHPNALIAAEAAVCADRQGMFWQMHDAMYADQSALSADALKDTARHIGVDSNQFADCMSDGSTAQHIYADTKAAQDLGIGATPFFFINGRPINGSVPLHDFESVITDELRRSSGSRG